MKVVLLQEVKKLGKKGEVLEVAEGYARNFLLPKKLAAAATADTMLTIEGVRVSFVLCPTEEGVAISARSDGDVNVQVIMEAFGGGGHQTVAGAQLNGVDMAEARRRLEAVIMNYIGEETES